MPEPRRSARDRHAEQNSAASAVGRSMVGTPNRTLGDRVIDRRTFIRAVVGGLIAWPLIATAQQAEHVPRIGYLTAAAHTFGMFPVEQAFLDGLHDHGYIEGR